LYLFLLLSVSFVLNSYTIVVDPIKIV